MIDTAPDTVTPFTAGPWIPDTVLPLQSQSDRDPVLAALITTREDANGTVKRVAVAYGATKAECEANARLIAAAPAQHCTLLRVVAAIEDMLEDDSLQITGECGDLLLQIASMSHAVLAKADMK